MNTIIIPIPIYHGGHGGASPEALLAMYIVLNIMCLIWLVVRYLFARKKVDKYIDIGNSLNFPSISLIMLNLMALIIFSTVSLMKFL